MAGACFAALLVVPAFAPADQLHTYPVTLTIEVDRSAKKISGAVSSDAPASFCEQSMVRLRRVMRGKDKIVDREFPDEFGGWSFRSKREIRGKRVYVEVSQYKLPERPVLCMAGRSRAVTAP